MNEKLGTELLAITLFTAASNSIPKCRSIAAAIDRFLKIQKTKLEHFLQRTPLKLYYTAKKISPLKAKDPKGIPKGDLYVKYDFNPKQSISTGQ